MKIRSNIFQRFLCLFLLVWLLTEWGAEVPFADAQDDLMVVGLLIRGKEVDMVEVLQREDAFLLPLISLIRAIGATIESSLTTERLITPLGSVSIEAGELLEINGIKYIHQRTVEERLHITVAFVPEEFALSLDIPWNPGAKERSAAVSELEAQFHPPRFGLSTFREKISYIEREGESVSTSSTLLGGRLFEGAWRIEFDSDFNDLTGMRDYTWYRSWNNTLLQLGQQHLALHPLLTGVEFTGLQLGWTNQPLERFSLTSTPRELLPRYSTVVQTFRGQAAPGFLAQLRVDGRIVDYQVVGLDRSYEFTDVPITSGALTQIEVYLFDYHDARVPADIHEFTVTSSSLLLPKGKHALLAGIGGSGNPLDEFIQPELAQPLELQSFLQWRQGFSENLTIEAAVQQHSDAFQVQAGMIVRAFESIILEAAGGLSNDKFAYNVNLETIFPRWHLLANSSFFPESYSLWSDSGKNRTHSAELHYRINDSIQVGIKGTHHETETEQKAFVLPFATWSLFSKLFLRAMPNSDGDYGFDGYTWLTPATRLSFLVEDTTSVELSRNLGSRYGVSLSATFEDGRLGEYAAIFRRHAGQGRDPYLHTGLTVRDDSIYYVAGGGVDLFPGIQAEVVYQGQALDQTRQESETYTLMFKLSTNFSMAGGRLFPASTESLRRNQGAIAGRIQVQTSPDSTKTYDLENITIMIGPARRVRTNHFGNFFCGNLQEGVYPVELDLENLPFELVPERTVLTARVAADAATRVDFVVRPEYGIAGRITDHTGNTLQGAYIELLDEQGNMIKHTLTDQFGLYRIDGLPPGIYRLRAATQSPSDPFMASPEREIEIVDDFLFGQDIQLPTLSQ
ncbi:Alr3592 protein [Candidatus Vecturithrix granuli]|uniref:Alr3592 protein n=1 Tax=Vecturithrix granuli TaxID=1499967 RepID=A0A081C656_VECG1|nr:Alr3592 protein [Candidatus Vecturithrix granuli]